ncbi:ATP/maltotriose-dependent transcriptional regulator MalT [Catenulispora sp. MAP12-49]|uniref:LuxR C-terminal-related transcriptional regulator n=1 Tax=Catenulispora sp. MAP12-49 TaxID=3156302 RepID=UPI0035190974
MFVAASQGPEGPLVGRDTETRRLVGVLEELGSGRGSVVEIAGDPGIGKTRLMNMLAEVARQRGVQVARAHAIRGSTVAYQVFREATGDWPGPDQSTTDDEAVFRAIRARMADLAADSSGGMLLLDDIHLCDEASAQLAARLVRTLAPGPLVLALAHQPRRTGSVLLEALEHGSRTGRVIRIEPQPLDAETVAMLLDHWRTSEGSAGVPYTDPTRRHATPASDSASRRPLNSPEFAEQLHAASGGNPRHLRVLVAGGWEPEHWPDRPGSDADGLLREAVAMTAELDALTPDASAAAQTAAVLGDPFRPEDVAEISGHDLDQILDALSDLVRADVVRPVASNGRFAFRHPLLRHIAHERAAISVLLTAHQRALDLFAARGVPAVQLARHAEYLVGTDASVAVNLLARGATEVLPDAPATAVRWLGLALENLPSGDRPTAERATLMLECSRALSASGRLEAARTMAHEVLRDHTYLAEHLRLKAYAARAAAERQLGRFAEAEASARTALHTLPRPLPAAAAELAFEYGFLHVFRGTYREARALVREVVSAATTGGEASTRGEGDAVSVASVRVLSAFGDSYLGDTAAVMPALLDSAQLVDGLPDSAAARTPELLAMLGCTELFTEQYSAASRHFRRGLALAQAGGPQQALAHCLLGLSYIDQEAGRLSQAEQWALEAERAARATGADDAISMSKAMRVGAMVWTRSQHDSAAVVALAEESARTAQPGWWAGSAAMQLAMVRLIGGDAPGCTEALLEGGGGEDLHLFQPNFHPMLLAMLSTAALFTGDADAAQRWARDGDSAAERLGLAVQRAHVDRAQAILHMAEGEHAMAAKLFEQAAHGFRRGGRPIHHAWTLVVGAHSAEGAHGSATAANWLASAMNLADVHGAVRVREEAAAAKSLLAASATFDNTVTESPRPDITALLTGRERQIADLVTAGKRSRDVAEQLFLSKRTVDAHLARIYHKLNVSSRTALTRLLLGADDAGSE